MKLKPYRELLKMTEVAIDEALAPIRARQARSKADLLIAKLEEKCHAFEVSITKACTQKELDLEHILEMLDERALVVRKISQLRTMITDLFPPSEVPK